MIDGSISTCCSCGTVISELTKKAGNYSRNPGKTLD